MDKDSSKSIVIYYSYEGNTRFIAQTIANEIHADILELKPKKEMKSKGFMKYVWGGKSVVLKQKPELESYQFNLENYHLIILGTPVWSFTFSPAMRTFFSEVTIKNKKVAVFCCHEGGMRNTLENMINEVPNNSIVGKNDFNHPLVKNKSDNEKKAILWAQDLIKTINQTN
jgi:flavodoxin